MLHHRHRFQARARAALLSLTGVNVGSDIRVGPDCEIHLGPAPARRGIIILGGCTTIERGVLLHPYGGKIETGIHVYIGPFTTIYGHGGVVIGNDTLISMHCRILSSEHSLPPPGTIIRSQPDVPKQTRIGADV